MANTPPGPLPEPFHELIEFSLLASQRDRFDPDGAGGPALGEAVLAHTLDDDFSSLVATVRLGRCIFDNLKKAMTYLVAIHVPIAGMSLLPVVLQWPLVLLPVHIAFLHLMIDPVCSVVFEAEAEEMDVMRRPPRDPHAALFSWQTIGLSVLQRLGILLVVFAVFGVALARAQGEEDARALTFTTLIIASRGLVFTNRSWSYGLLATMRVPNPALWWVTGGTCCSV